MREASWRDRLQAAPLWVLFLYFLAFGPLFAGGLLLFDPAITALDAVVLAVVAGPLFALAMTGTTVLVRRRDRAVAGELSRADKVAVARAARTGALPADRKLDDRMLALVTRRRKQNRDSLLYGPLMFGVLVVFAIIQALSGDARFWVLAALMLVLLISTVIQGRSNLAKLDRLATALMNRRSGTIGEG